MTLSETCRITSCQDRCPATGVALKLSRRSTNCEGGNCACCQAMLSWSETASVMEVHLASQQGQTLVLPKCSCHSLPCLYRRLGGNQLSGTLPEAWACCGGFPLVYYMSLASNNLSGTLPPSWAPPALPSLGGLQLDANPRLCGPVPDALYPAVSVQLNWWFLAARRSLLLSWGACKRLCICPGGNRLAQRLCCCHPFSCACCGFSLQLTPLGVPLAWHCPHDLRRRVAIQFCPLRVWAKSCQPVLPTSRPHLRPMVRGSALHLTRKPPQAYLGCAYAVHALK